MKDRQFLSELAELTQALRREIEAKAQGLDPSPAAIAARRRRVLVDQDYAFFAWNYFPHHIWGEPSQFQQHLCARLPQLLAAPGGCREWWIAPRGESKSTLTTKIAPVFIAVLALLQSAEVRAELGLGEAPPFLDYVVLFGAETRLPTKLLAVVRTELETNPRLAMDFPEAVGAGPVWKVGEIVTATGVKIEPFGADQAVRGTFHGASRPKVGLGDDLIKDSEAKSKTESEARWDWLQKAADYLGPPDGSFKLINVGTILSKHDPLSRAQQTIGHIVHHFRAIERLPADLALWAQCEELMRNADRPAEVAASERGELLADEARPSYRFYLQHQAEMDAGAVTSWPAVRSLYWLMRQRATNPRAFGTEMQGEPRSDEDKVFHPQFWVQRGTHWIPFGACDPSMGRGESSDPSAIVIGGWDRELARLCVMHAEIKRRLPSKLEADLIAAQREYGCQAIAFENNNAYEHMRVTLMRAGIAAGVPLPLIGVTAVVGPEVRIDSLEPYVVGLAPRILFHPGLTQLLAELDDWPEPQIHHHYDGLTALHLLWHVASTRARGVPRIASVRPQGFDR